MDTLLYVDERCQRHDPGTGHPENAGRVALAMAELAARPVPGTRAVTPPLVAREALLAVHTPAHVERMQATAGRSRSQLDADTAACADSWTAACLAAGAVVEAVERAVAGEARGAFCLLRPPGHHAEAGQAMGFCLLNNVAVAAAHAVAALGCRRVLVLDPDVHHGNGTQHLFEHRRDVLYVSSHQAPFYPGTGAVGEIGVGEGAGFTINLPLPAGQGDADYAHVYRAVVDPVVRAWQPDLILVSAGFDIWHRDPLGGMAVTRAGLATLYALFRSWADASCPGRLVSTLEGGYDPAGVAAGTRLALEATAAAHVEAPELTGTPSPAARAVADRARALLAPHWPTLRG